MSKTPLIEENFPENEARRQINSQYYITQHILYNFHHYEIKLCCLSYNPLTSNYIFFSINVFFFFILAVKGGTHCFDWEGLHYSKLHYTLGWIFSLFSSSILVASILSWWSVFFFVRGVGTLSSVKHLSVPWELSWKVSKCLFIRKRLMWLVHTKVRRFTAGKSKACRNFSSERRVFAVVKPSQTAEPLQQTFYSSIIEDYSSLLA